MIPLANGHADGRNADAAEQAARVPVGPATPNGRRNSSADWSFPFPVPGRWQGKKRLPANTEMRRSEERRVGKECRSRWWPYHLKKKRRLILQDSHRPILIVYERGRKFALENHCPYMVFSLERGSVEDFIFFFKQKTAYEITR